MARRSENAWIILAALFLAGGAAFALYGDRWVAHVVNRDATTPVAVAKPPTPATAPPVAEKPSPPEPLDDDTARTWFAGQVEDRAVVGPSPLSGDDGLGYGRIEVAFNGGTSLETLFFRIQPDPTEAVILTATVTLSGGRRFDDLPLLILAPGADGPQTLFAAPFLRTPFLRLDGAERVAVDFNTDWVPAQDLGTVNRLAALAGGVSEALAVAPAQWPPHAEAAVREGGSAFGQVLAAARSRRIEGLISLALGLDADPAPAGHALLFKAPSGRPLSTAQVRLEARRSLFGGAVLAGLGYRDVMNVKIGEAGTLGDHFAAVSDRLARFLDARDPKRALDACTALRDEMADTLGLNLLDVSVVLAVTARPRGVFAGGTSGLESCLGDRGAALLKAAGMAFVEPAAPRLGAKTMNDGLNRLARGFGAAEPEREIKALSKGFSDRVVLEDRTGLWLLADADLTLPTEAGAIDPAADPDEAARRLAELPVAAFGCYHRGDAGPARSRAALLSLAGDDGLWAMESVFDASGKILGLQLRAAGQAEFCRATGSTGSTPNRCVFARETQRRRDIDPARCGR